ncbi:MAG: ATPase [Devosiaceae bacterium]|nr:ATPase [Devosiaceae bacterium]
MLFESADAFVGSTSYAVTAFGMSGVGKTRASAMLRADNWFHYSIDYRIGTRYMGEFIVDNLKHEAMKVPFLNALLHSDSIDISSNLRFENLEPLSAYLGSPGNAAQGGLSLKEYQKRQEQHRIAEISAMLDVPYFITRAKKLYNYDNFIADTGGSLIEIVDPASDNDQVINVLCASTALLYIRGTDSDAQALIDRYKASPKPMYYRPELLIQKWAEFKKINHIERDEDVSPAEFGAWGFEAILNDRLPRYQALADRFGYTIDGSELSTARDSKDFLELMRKAVAKRNEP